MGRVPDGRKRVRCADGAPGLRGGLSTSGALPPRLILVRLLDHLGLFLLALKRGIQDGLLRLHLVRHMLAWHWPRQAPGCNRLCALI